MTHSKTVYRLTGALLLSALLTCTILAEDATKTTAPTNTDTSPKTHKVVAEPIKATVELTGVFAASETAEVVYTGKTWTQLKVKSVVSHGATVKKGDTLITPDMEPIDKDLEKRKVNVEISNINLVKAKEDLRYSQLTTPRWMVYYTLVRDRSNDDLARYLNITKPLNIKSTKAGLKNSAFSLEYAIEGLRQLEKMYKDDDLTEETEEIILKRQRNGLERSKLSYEISTHATQRKLEIDYPRILVDKKRSNIEAQMQYENKKVTLPLDLKIKRLTLINTKRTNDKANKDLNEILEDREKQVLTAPADGVVYYGEFVDGVWQGASKVKSKLKPRGILGKHEVAMTVINPDSLFVHATVSESQLYKLKNGLQGKAKPTAFPDQKLAVQLDDFAITPNASGQFTATLKLTNGRGQLMPGMKCKVKLTYFDKADAITVPTTSCWLDDNQDSWYIYVKENDKPVKRFVKVGPVQGKKKVITSGLNTGEEIYLKKPK